MNEILQEKNQIELMKILGIGYGNIETWKILLAQF